MCLSILVSMRVHKGVIIGMLLDWLASSIAAGLICGYLLGRAGRLTGPRLRGYVNL